MKFSLEHQNNLIVSEISQLSLNYFPSSNYSFMHIDNSNVLVWALKPHEDGIQSGVVVR